MTAKAYWLAEILWHLLLNCFMWLLSCSNCQLCIYHVLTSIMHVWPWLLGDLYGSIVALQCLQRIPLQQHHWYRGMLQSIATLCAMERNTTSTNVSFPDQIPMPFVPLLVSWTALKVYIINELYANALKFAFYCVQLSLHATVMAILGWSTKRRITPLMAPSQS